MMLTIFHSMTLIVEIFVKFVSSPGFIRVLGDSERIVKHIVFLFGLRATRIQLEWHLLFYFATFSNSSQKVQKILPNYCLSFKVDQTFERGWTGDYKPICDAENLKHKKTLSFLLCTLMRSLISLLYILLNLYHREMYSRCTSC